MHIARLTALHVRIPLKHPVAHASHTRESNDTLLVRCDLSDGTAGWGEGLPRPYVTGETIDTAWEQVQHSNFAGQLNGSITAVSTAVELLDTVRLVEPSTINHQPSTIRDCFGNAVHCAFELSILDAVCLANGVPLSAVTTLVPEAAAIRKSAARVRYSGAITGMSAWKQVRSAFKQRVYGFHQCKVKVGMAGDHDAATLRRVRRILGAKVELRIDANEAWSCETVVEKVNPLRAFNVTSVEQPVPHSEVGGLAGVRKQIGVPIMLDESLCSLADGRRAIDEGLCDLFNIRLSKCGGFINSLRLAAMAHKAGLGYQLGCQVGETGILSAAGRHFACSIGGFRSLEGSYDRHLVAERLTREDMTFGYGGWAPALTGPGLGVTVETAAIERCAVRKAVVWER